MDLKQQETKPLFCLECAGSQCEHVLPAEQLEPVFECDRQYPEAS